MKMNAKKSLKKFHEMLMANDASATVNFYDAEHLDCFWYDGNNIVSIDYKGFVICIDVCGDISISLQNVKDEELNFKHKGCGRPFFEDTELKSYIKDDKKLNYYTRNGDLVFENNNWINVVIFNSETNEYISEPYVAGSSDVLQAAIEEFMPCKKYIDEYLKKEEKEG